MLFVVVDAFKAGALKPAPIRFGAEEIVELVDK